MAGRNCFPNITLNLFMFTINIHHNTPNYMHETKIYTSKLFKILTPKTKTPQLNFSVMIFLMFQSEIQESKSSKEREKNISEYNAFKLNTSDYTEKKIHAAQRTYVEHNKLGPLFIILKHHHFGLKLHLNSTSFSL